MEPFKTCTPPERGHRPFTQLTDNTTVDLIIETEDGESTFTVPKQYLVAVSPYFEKAFSGQWSKAREKQIRLAEVGSSTMHMFVGWLFTREIVLVIHGHEAPSAIDLAIRADQLAMTDECLDIAERLQRRILSLYIFGDRFDVPQLRRDAIDEMSELSFSTSAPPHANVVSLAYNHLPESSPMIKLFIDAYAQLGGESDVQAARAQNVPMEFFADVLLLHMKSPVVRAYNPCYYHGHNEKNHAEITKK